MWRDVLELSAAGIIVSALLAIGVLVGWRIRGSWDGARVRSPFRGPQPDDGIWHSPEGQRALHEEASALEAIRETERRQAGRVEAADV